MTIRGRREKLSIELFLLSMKHGELFLPQHFVKFYLQWRFFFFNRILPGECGGRIWGPPGCLLTCLSSLQARALHTRNPHFHVSLPTVDVSVGQDHQSAQHLTANVSI